MQASNQIYIVRNDSFVIRVGKRIFKKHIETVQVKKYPGGLCIVGQKDFVIRCSIAMGVVNVALPIACIHQRIYCTFLYGGNTSRCIMGVPLTPSLATSLVLHITYGCQH